MLTPNLFEVNTPFDIPTNPSVIRKIGFQKTVKHYNVSLWPFSIRKPSVNDCYISKKIHKYIDPIIEDAITLTNSQLIGILITPLYVNKNNVYEGQISLKDMIDQYNDILAYQKNKRKLY